MKEIYDDDNYLLEIGCRRDKTVTEDLQKHIANVIERKRAQEIEDLFSHEAQVEAYAANSLAANGALTGGVLYPGLTPYPPYTMPWTSTPDGTAKVTTTDAIKIDVPKKDGNPKTSVGSRKFSLSVMSSAVTAEIALGMLEGARKYGRHNWRDEGAMASIYWDAAMRHLIKWWEGEDIDPDSGLPHIVKAMASLYVLRDAMICETWVDDRPPALPEGWYNDLDRVAAEIIERYPDAREPHLNKKFGIDD
ncbi:hypothetical protein PHIM7_199 [Sinorhizobium phage phiM7]|uniref:dATP/dGTP diphosphohydrolase N-terminal domain-containing protein n=2 Tax=Emdodecavirus TaxID=1980937 RepID=A0A0F6WCW8_9CAUD|nr:endolysin; inhibits RNA polymerase [Sinorhizobium phage phiN3]YP_009601324.1 endolysin; inhibits RNA polymerase [Sinorhizobium phage phiM7]AKF12744.1 hypothetical protein PHIM7_199 [Sinorhizobium phage phiM7]AKF13104.1 hypothetical protein PHIM19_199 [Sinorhizobium phage phiM19]AKF13474.1 hypothetical protein PHIN3_211 [Sinorhizobium phage phiN3]